MPRKKTLTAAPVLYIVVYSNFEGFCTDPARARQGVEGFEQLTARHPEIVWTHMFNPIHLVGTGPKRQCGEVFVPYLRRLIQRQPLTEVGLHLHLFLSLVEALGIKPRTEPRGDGTQPHTDGYDVLITGYPQSEREAIVGKCVAAFESAGLPRPTSFCTGYSATDPALQAYLDRTGFTTSFAAQVIPSGIPGVSHQPSWYKLLEWGENVTPLSRPYRVGTKSILPTPGGPYLDHLVEVPLTTDQDIRQLYLYHQPVSRRNILDFHYELVRATGRSSCVPFGVHDCYMEEGEMRGPVHAEMAANLDHVRRIIQRGDVRVEFASASAVAHSVLTEPERW